MSRLAQLPDDMVFFTQITMEAAEDPEFLDAMKAARIKGALVGVESVTPEGLKDVYKDFNLAGEKLTEQLRTFRRHGVHVLGSFIFGLPSDRPETFAATAAAAISAECTFAQFVMLSPYPGTVDFNRWEKTLGDNPPTVAGIPLTRRWLIPQALRPKLYWDHPVMSGRRNPLPNPGRVGQFLRLGSHLETFQIYQVQPGPVGLCAHLQNLSDDVCRYRHRHGQRARHLVRTLDPVDG